MTDVDMVNHPPHYQHPSGVQCIEITRLCHGNMSAYIQYVWRYDAKGTPEQDLAKARWYMRDTLANGLPSSPPYRAKCRLLGVINAETDLIRRELLTYISVGHVAEAIDRITVLVGE